MPRPASGHPWLVSEHPASLPWTAEGHDQHTLSYPPGPDQVCNPLKVCPHKPLPDRRAARMSPYRPFSNAVAFAFTPPEGVLNICTPIEFFVPIESELLCVVFSALFSDVAKSPSCAIHADTELRFAWVTGAPTAIRNELIQLRSLPVGVGAACTVPLPLAGPPPVCVTGDDVP